MKPIKDKKITEIIYNYSDIIVYHTRRKVFRLFRDASTRSKWNKNLCYCHKSLEYADSDKMITRTLNEYVKNPGLYEIYFNNFNNDDLSSYRSMKDIIHTMPENFI